MRVKEILKKILCPVFLFIPIFLFSSGYRREAQGEERVAGIEQPQKNISAQNNLSNTADEHETENASNNNENIQNPLTGIDLSRAVVRQDRLVQTIGNREIIFTIDPQLQNYALELLRRYQVPAGAIVVLNSRTGSVLTFASYCHTQPCIAIPDGALDASSPAASVFKIVTATALLEIISDLDSNTEFCYHGGTHRITEDLLEENPQHDNLCLSFGSAFGFSVNTIFARLGLNQVGRKRLLAYAQRYGFNTQIPFELPVNMSRYEAPEDNLEFARSAAGFWHSYLSPLQGALMAQAIAQDGSMLTPYIVDEVRQGNSVLLNHQPHFLRTVMRDETSEKLTKIMLETTKRGTARHAFYDHAGNPYLPAKIKVAGKTGTLDGSDPYRSFSWFIGFAPADSPEIAFAVLIVNTPQWRIKAPVAAREFLKRYFRGRS